MHRRMQLWLGVSALALLGAVTLPAPVLAEPGNSQDIDPDGGMANECGESSGCAEAGESFESRTYDELGDDEDGGSTFRPPATPRSRGGGLSGGDSVRGGMNDGGLGH